MCKKTPQEALHMLWLLSSMKMQNTIDILEAWLKKLPIIISCCFAKLRVPLEVDCYTFFRGRRAPQSSVLYSVYKLGTNADDYSYLPVKHEMETNYSTYCR